MSCSNDRRWAWTSDHAAIRHGSHTSWRVKVLIEPHTKAQQIFLWLVLRKLRNTIHGVLTKDLSHHVLPVCWEHGMLLCFCNGSLHAAIVKFEHPVTMPVFPPNWIIQSWTRISNSLSISLDSCWCWCWCRAGLFHRSCMHRWVRHWLL